MRFRWFLCSALALTLVCAGSASADQALSSNWSGYVVHRRGVKFTRVYASWKQPHVRCRRGHASYSAMWVGLGGFAYSSQALEQVGTEVDCTRAGRTASTAWIELVPAASEVLRLRVRPGDQLAAQVTVVGHQVTLGLVNLTRHTSFRRSQYAQFIDVSSAEWILEAPSVCAGYNDCVSLPLANFRTARFTGAQAQTMSGYVGTISDQRWNRTQIRLRPTGRRFVVRRGGGTPAGAANPSRLIAGGSSFKVSFARVFVRLHLRHLPRSPQVRASDLVHAALAL